MRIIHSVHQAQDILLIDNDSRKAEYAPRRIVRMNRHINVILVAYRHNALQEVNQIFKEFLVVDIFIHREKLLDLCHALRLPARHHGSVHIAGNGIEHILRI